MFSMPLWKSDSHCVTEQCTFQPTWSILSAPYSYMQYDSQKGRPKANRRPMECHYKGSIVCKMCTQQEQNTSTTLTQLTPTFPAMTFVHETSILEQQLVKCYFSDAVWTMECILCQGFVRSQFLANCPNDKGAWLLLTVCKQRKLRWDQEQQQQTQ